MVNKTTFGLFPTKLIQRIIAWYPLLIIVPVVLLVACTTSVSSVKSTPSVIPEATPTSTKAPAAVQLVGLKVSPTQVRPGQKVAVIATVINTGNIEGTYTADLGINNTSELTTEINVPAGKTKTFSIFVSREIPGTYEVNCSEFSGQFKVTELGTAKKANSPTANSPGSSTPSCCR